MTMTNADRLPAPLLQRKAVVYVRQSSQARKRPGAPVEAASGRERPVEEGGCRVDAGQGDADRRSEKKVVKPSPRRSIVDYLKSTYAVAERRACRLVALSRSVYQYRSHRDPQTALRQRMCEIAATRVRYGYRKIRVLLQREGYQVSKNRLYRLYREEGLSLRYRPNRKRRAQMSRPARARATAANHAWSLDFVADQLAGGQRFRALTIVDVFTREALAIDVGQRLGASDVVRVLEQLRLRRGTPRTLLCDNGSEFTSQVMDLWASITRSRLPSAGPASQRITRSWSPSTARFAMNV
ncbi:transposase [Paraburkholderia kururiensis]